MGGSVSTWFFRILKIVKVRKAFLLFLGHTKLSPTSGPENFILLMPGMFFLQSLACSPSFFILVSIKILPFQETYTKHNI